MIEINQNKQEQARDSCVILSSGSCDHEGVKVTWSYYLNQNIINDT